MKCERQARGEGVFRAKPYIDSKILRTKPAILAPVHTEAALPDKEIKIVLMQHGVRCTKTGKHIPAMTEIYSDLDEDQTTEDLERTTRIDGRTPLKRSSNAFFQYRSDPDVKSRWKSKTKKYQQRHVVQDISTEWNNLSAVGKLPYEQKAIRAAEAYKRSLHKQRMRQQIKPRTEKCPEQSEDTSDFDLWLESITDSQLLQQLTNAPNTSYFPSFRHIDYNVEEQSSVLSRSTESCWRHLPVESGMSLMNVQRTQYTSQDHTASRRRRNQACSKDLNWPCDLSWMPVITHC